MHVVAPKGASTCRSKGPKEEWIERTYDYVVASGSLQGKISQMEVEQDFESRPQKGLLYKPKVLPGYSGGRLPGMSTKEKGREEGAADEDREERKVRSQIAQKVVACMHQGEGK